MFLVKNAFLVKNILKFAPSFSGAWQGNIQLRDDAESEAGSTLNLIRQKSESDLASASTNPTSTMPTLDSQA
jgi:hypothetical protein